MKTALLLEGEGNTVIKDPMRTSYLEVYTDVEAATWAMEPLLSPTYLIRNLLVRPAYLHDLLTLV